MTAALVPLSSDARFRLLQAGVNAADFAHDVRTGLTAGRKWLPPRWFYDDLGSSLFDAICFLPEYYVMRAETEVLTSFRGRSRLPSVRRAIRRGARRSASSSWEAGLHARRASSSTR